MAVRGQFSVVPAFLSLADVFPLSFFSCFFFLLLGKVYDVTEYMSFHPGGPLMPLLFVPLSSHVLFFFLL
jgi:hypothetical protein